MDINVVNNTISSIAVPSTPLTVNTQQTADVTTLPAQGASNSDSNTQQSVPSAQVVNGQPSDDSKAATYDGSKNKNTDNANSKSPDKKKVQDITQQLNHFMDSINTDIRFKLHEKTHQFSVDVVDSKTGKVIKECPSREFFAMVDALKEYIGAFVDKKA